MKKYILLIICFFLTHLAVAQEELLEPKLANITWIAGNWKLSLKYSFGSDDRKKFSVRKNPINALL